MMHDLRPDLKRKAVQQAFDRTVRPKHKKELTGIVKANATTVKRTVITVPQQYIPLAHGECGGHLPRHACTCP